MEKSDLNNLLQLLQRCVQVLKLGFPRNESLHKNLQSSAIYPRNRTLFMCLKAPTNASNRAAEKFPTSGVTVFEPSPEETKYLSYTEASSGAVFLSYETLFTNIKAESRAVQGLLNLNDAENRVVVLYTDDHLEGLHWFWSIVAAGGLPCISPPFNNDLEQRRQQIGNLFSLCTNPIFVTSERLRSQFEVFPNLTLFTFREIEACRARLEFRAGNNDGGFSQHLDDNAVLMLTSGSTGDSKIVALKHRHLLAAVNGKSDANGTTPSDKFLNWTGLDHVTNLSEIHLQALFLGADQYHMPETKFLSNPISFLQCISDNRISYTFAPNFFLGLLKDELESTVFDDTVVSTVGNGESVENNSLLSTVAREDVEDVQSQTSPLDKTTAFDLSCLQALISGGEANPVSTCVSIRNLLSAFGARDNFIRPGFGMTETCGGSIYNVLDCPTYDIAQGLESACLGKGIHGMAMRISKTEELELQGSMVFEEYYNDLVNTKLAFTSDGWFRTGDMGSLDHNGRLCLSGRYKDKDMVTIDGVSIPPQAIENAIGDAKISFDSST